VVAGGIVILRDARLLHGALVKEIRLGPEAIFSHLTDIQKSTIPDNTELSVTSSLA
jgi:hypothetical protein